MINQIVKARLEEQFDAIWQGKEGDPCIWWQGEWWSWNRVNDLAHTCEKELKRAGFKRGQRIVALLPNSPIEISLSLAAWRLGGAFAPLNVRTSLINILATVKKLDAAVVFVTEDQYRESKYESAACSVPVIPTPLDMMRRIEPALREGISDSPDTAVIFSTSGTTGNPKAVPCSHANLLAELRDYTIACPPLVTEDGKVFLNVLPNFHTFGYVVTGLLALLYGFRQVVVPSFVPVENTVRDMRETGVNVIIAVPTLLSFLLGYLAKNGETLSGIKLIISGGDKLNVKLDKLSQEYLGVGICEGYGLTECCPAIAVNSSIEDRKLGTVGRKFPSAEIEIRDMQGKPLGPHEEGVMWVKGPFVVNGYFRDETSTNERFKDGWCNTGDVVRIDEDGFITIVDRSTDIIIVSGFNVYPQEVEKVLCQHPGVLSAIAVAEKNNITGEIVKAFIIPEEDAQVTAKGIIDYAKERLAHYKVPRKIGFLTEFPLSPTGKVLRRELRKMKAEKI